MNNSKKAVALIKEIGAMAEVADNALEMLDQVRGALQAIAAVALPDKDPNELSIEKLLEEIRRLKDLDTEETDSAGQ